MIDKYSYDDGAQVIDKPTPIALIIAILDVAGRMA